MVRKSVTVVGAGYTGLTTAAELTFRGFEVRVVAQDLGYRPPLTIVGTQVRGDIQDFFVLKEDCSRDAGLDLLSVTRLLTMTIFSTRSCRQSPGFWLSAPNKKLLELPSFLL